MPQQANYMQYAVFGGERGPGDYASTALGPLQAAAGPPHQRGRLARLELHPSRAVREHLVDVFASPRQ
jgi:hypothetical protein